MIVFALVSAGEVDYGEGYGAENPSDGLGENYAEVAERRDDGVCEENFESEFDSA